MYEIKRFPEDFIVNEISNLKPDKEGDYSYFLLKKRNLTTQEAAGKIADFLKLRLKFIGYAGNKDKKAITEQLISIRMDCKDRLTHFENKNIQLKFIGKGKSPISLGDLEGNSFEITARNLSKKNIEKISKIKNKKAVKIINYFGEQRFSKNNAEIGKLLLKKQFQEALKLISPNLKTHNPIKELKKIPKKILMLYVHAYQSKIWNDSVKEFLKKKDISKLKGIKIPVIGFGVEYGNKKIEEIIKIILKKEKITERDFIIREIPEISSEGSERDLTVEVKNLKMDINSKEKTCRLSFSLKKGCYATVAVNQFLS